MNMDKQSSQNNEKAQKTDGDRPYGCPCGKFYLSYPALFTHIKQKHDGKAPGQLIKPESGKVRGRPKTKPSIEDIKEAIDPKAIVQTIRQLIKNTEIEYSEKFQKSSGEDTCQDIASIFLEEVEQSKQGNCQVLECFLNELQHNVTSKNNKRYWRQKKANQLIDIANQVFINHQNLIDKFPLPEQLLKDLLYNFFEWLYAKKYTNHRLVKKQNNEK